jgi:capsid protein
MMKFIWPKMPSIDPLKTAKAIQQEIANGTTDYSELLGPDWKEILTKLAGQLNFAKSKGLTLSDAVAIDPEIENMMESADDEN